MNISIVIPLLNEEESIPELTDWIKKVMDKHNYSYEIVFLDDGSTDSSWKQIQIKKSEGHPIKGIRFRRNYGKSAGLNTAFGHVSGDVIITMDADLQDSPEEIPGLYEMIKDQGFDLVSGWKKKRHDPVFTKNLPSKFFNWAARKMSGIQLNDFNCGLKAYKREVVDNIEVYGDMHRYIPIIAKTAGFPNIGEKVVAHQARKYGISKFGLNRFIHGFLDLVTITFVGKFGKRPMHFFGATGVLSTFLGAVILIWLTISKLFYNITGISERPLFFLGILLVIVGLQLFIAGFMAELISRNAQERNQYKIKEYIDISK